LIDKNEIKQQLDFIEAVLTGKIPNPQELMKK